MRVALIGEVDFSLAIFQEVSKSEVDVVGICARAHTSGESDKIDLSSYAFSLGIPSNVVRSVNDPQNIQWLLGLKPQAIFCIGWSEILSKDVLDICPGKVIGFHPSDLPRHRGRHPIIWTLALGLPQIASTFFIMDEFADAGNILLKEVLPIDEDDYASDVYRKVINAASIQVREVCRLLLTNDLAGVGQDARLASYWRKRTTVDGIIDWRMSSRSIRNLVRALAHPYPGATFILSDQAISCQKAKIVSWDKDDVEPGKVLHTAPGALVVKTGDGAVEVSELSSEPNVEIGDYL